MHTVKIIFEAWFTVLAVWITFRCWQGGCFDTGLECLFGWTKADDSEEWMREEFERDLYGLQD